MLPRCPLAVKESRLTCVEDFFRQWLYLLVRQVIRVHVSELLQEWDWKD
jgi:hypothetical protein